MFSKIEEKDAHSSNLLILFTHRILRNELLENLQVFKLLGLAKHFQNLLIASNNKTFFFMVFL